MGKLRQEDRASWALLVVPKLLVEITAEPLQSAVWGPGGAEPDLRSPLAHNLGRGITLTPFVFSVGHNYKPINSSPAA